MFKIGPVKSWSVCGVQNFAVQRTLEHIASAAVEDDSLESLSRLTLIQI